MTRDDPRRYTLRQLTDEDRRLWNAIARSIQPLRRRPLDSGPEEDAPAAAPARPHPVAKAAKPVRPDGEAPRLPAAGPAVPVLSPLARRERQRLARGGVPIEARIDLHGLTQSEAHAALARFLRRAQADGARFALVITGKGARAGADIGERGILRRQVPQWLKLPEFRPYVVGFEDAHTTHGGQGALYVRIRKGRQEPGPRP